MVSSALQSKEPREIRRLSMRVLHDLRSAIPAGRIVRRLGGFAIGEWETVRTGPETYEERPIEMNANQVRAAVALLNKCMPDLQSMQLEVTKNDFEGQSVEQLRAKLRSIVTGTDAIDVQATMVQPSKVDLLSIEAVSRNDLLDWE